MCTEEEYPELPPVMEDQLEQVSSGIIKQLIGVDDDDLDHLPISLWAANHADLVNKIAREEVLVEDIDKEKEETIIR